MQRANSLRFTHPRVAREAFGFLFIFILAFSGQAPSAQAAVAKERVPVDARVPHEFIVKFKGAASPTAAFSRAHSLASIHKLAHRQPKLDGLYAVKTSVGSDDVRSLRALQKDPDVEYAEPNYVFHVALAPNDPLFAQQWALHNTGQTGGVSDVDIDAPEAWDAVHSSSTVVGIIDTGIDYTHPDLAQNVWTNPGEIAGNGIDDDGNGYVDDVHGWDFVNNDNDPKDDHGHGTHVAGTIAAIGNNGIGVSGVAWNGKVAALKFLAADGSGTSEGALEAVAYATAMGFKITNNSWGGGAYSQALLDAITAAGAQGDLFVAAAGNDGQDADQFPMYPAAYNAPNIISVAALDHNGALANFSNYGLQSVDIAAPGQNILSTVPTIACNLCNPSGYATLSGTSMATPHVSGAAALLASALPELSAIGLKDRLLKLSDGLPGLLGKIPEHRMLNIGNVFEQDANAPAATVLSLTEKTTSSISLAWAAPGDDGLNGRATRYDLRFSDNPIDENSFNLATHVANVTLPDVPGTPQMFTIEDLEPNTTYYVALKTLDNAGNPSPLSNVLTVTTFSAATIFSDTMEQGANGWVEEGGGGLGGSGLWHQSTRRSSSPSTAWYYGVESAGNYATPGRNYGSLISPEIDLTHIPFAELLFKQHLNREEDGVMYDLATVSITMNDGASWETLSSNAGDTGSSWAAKKFNLSAYEGSRVKIRFSFDSVDGGLNDAEGWYIDDVLVRGFPTQRPVASAGGPLYSGERGVPILVDGSASFDPDGDPLTYAWTFGDGSSLLTNTPIVSHAYANDGEYYINLTVNDGLIDSVPAAARVVVTSNQRPTAQLNGPYTAIEDQSRTFSAAGSSDPEGSSLSYRWTFGDGTSATTAASTVNHLYTRDGVYTISLIVNDGTLDSLPVSTSVTVTPVNDSPVAEAGSDQTGGAQQSFSFSGVGSTDEEGALQSYAWTFGDGGVASGMNVTHAYSTAGTYTVRLTVTDAGGLTASDTLLVTVVPDTVTITKAVWKKSTKQLTVEATSSRGNAPVMTVVGYGTMTYVANLGRYQLVKNNVNTQPATVTVTSSFGGTDTDPTTKL